MNHHELYNRLTIFLEFSYWNARFVVIIVVIPIRIKNFIIGVS